MNAPTPYLAQAAMLLDAGRVEDAQTLLMRQARGKTHPHTFHLLAISFEMVGQMEKAIFYAAKAAAADPRDAVLAAGYAQRLFTADRTAEALAAVESAVVAHPADSAVVSAHLAMLTMLHREAETLDRASRLPAALRDHVLLVDVRALALTKLGRIEEARRLCLAAGRLRGGASALLAVGRVSEAAEELRAVCERFPSDDGILTFYASTLNYLDNAPLDETLRAHCMYAAALKRRLGPPASSWNVSPLPDRKLHIGIVSPDLRLHAIVSFLRPLLENYSRAEWRVTAYSITHKQDAVSAALRSLVDQWRWLPTSHQALLVRRMHEDQIDVAIELSGHTEGHRLDVMHLRPAPVQATYLGYPNTTGLDAIDIRIVDSITDPPGAERWASESLSRIDPCFLCFKPIVDAPELVAPPSAAAAPVAFGSFNLPKKISPRTLAMWGRLLAAVPDSTLVLKHAVLTHDWMRDQLSVRLAEAGIDSARVVILPPAPGYADHLAAYGRIDVALDTFPYHGTTTTCEAMWMGVPVVTLLGDRHASRVGASLLSAVGLSDLIASDEGAFVRIASALAADLPRRAAWRVPGSGSLRAIMAASPLCDGPAFAARFQGAIREAWRAWCAGRAAGAGTTKRP